MPFKTYDQLKIQGGLGPKIRQGDMMTPEGTFNIVTPTISTNYFTASRIDYENWKERKDMLEGLSNSEINPSDKGGAILIHGAGGSNGCLSFNSNIDSAYFTAIARNKTKAGQPLKMSVYPAQLSEELIESSSSIPDLKKYKNFWKKLSVNYNKEKARTNNNVTTLNEIKDKQDQ
jgi:murein L,D-transpeptidase YafK